MLPWTISNETDDKLNCFNNTNYNDEALKKCRNLSTFHDWLTECDLCCNRDICEQYAEKPEIKFESVAFDFENSRPTYSYWDFGNGEITWISSSDNLRVRFV